MVATSSFYFKNDAGNTTKVRTEFGATITQRLGQHLVFLIQIVNDMSTDVKKLEIKQFWSGPNLDNDGNMNWVLDLLSDKILINGVHIKLPIFIASVSEHLVVNVVDVKIGQNVY